MKKEITFSDSQIEKIREIVREELIRPRDTLVLRPAMSGKRLEAERAKISASVDSEIEKALRLKARELRVPVGVVIESALHDYLGRPKLSFELEAPKESSKEDSLTFVHAQKKD